MKKYKLTDETMLFRGRTLHRIVALRDFNDVKKGDKGGWIEKEENLSQEGECWVFDNAQVYDNAQIFGNARVFYSAKVFDNAQVYGSAQVYDNAQIFGNARVFYSAKVFDNAQVYGSAQVYDNAQIFGNARVFYSAKVFDNAQIFGNARVFGNAIAGGDAEISNKADYIVFKNWWSSGRYFTWTRSNNMWSVGCFYGTGDELIKKAYEDSEDKGKHYEEIVEYVNKCVLKNEQETK
jgi:UDP-3-O-[3-hydroxymyristoyl] glucosamine N-acyltransferase